MTVQSATAENIEVNVEEQELTKIDKAKAVVRKNMYWAMGLGVIPIPLVDLVSIAGFQAKAIKELSDLYEIPFKQHAVKNIVATLFSGLGAPVCGQFLAFSFIRAIPIIGPLTGLVATPLMAGAFTYATGKVFIQHFESGGTFLNLDPVAVRAYFKEEFEKGKGIASEMLKQKPVADSNDPNKKK